jgi:hypothetical protein
MKTLEGLNRKEKMMMNGGYVVKESCMRKWPIVIGCFSMVRIMSHGSLYDSFPVTDPRR